MKKFINDVLNDRYAHLVTAIQSVAKLSFCPSFGAPLVFLRSPYGDSEMARNGFEDGLKWCSMSNTYSSVNEAGFVGLRTYVQKPMKPSSISWASNRPLLSNVLLFLMHIKA